MSKIIAVDFDGTLCENKWPDIGAANKQLISWLFKSQDMGYRLILWTCRQGDDLKNAVAWCQKQGLYFDAVNANLPDRIAEYGDSRKVSADIFIDDRNIDVNWLELPFVAKPEKPIQISWFDLYKES